MINCFHFQVENDETRDEMPYVDAPETEFQKFIRLRKDGEPNLFYVWHPPMHI